MTSNLRGAITVAFVGALLHVTPGCSGSSLPHECAALVTCCSNPNLGGGASSCIETATSGESAALCATQLAMFRANGSCPADAGAADASH